MWNTLKQPEIRPDRHAFDTPQKRSGSGVSRCSLWYIYKSCYRPPGVVRRWNQHGLWGVGLLVGLDGFESLDRDGGAGAAGEFTTEADADARSRVSKPSRARNAVERRFRRRSGAVGLAGFGGARAGRPQAPRPRQRPASCGGQTASGTWAGTAQRSERRRTFGRGTPLHAHGQCQSNRSTSQRR